MANDITLGIKIKLDGREVDGQVRLLAEDMNRLSQATQNQGNVAQQSAAQNSRALGSIRAGLNEVKQTLLGLASLAALTGLVKGIVATNVAMESLRGQLNALTGSAQLGAKAFQFIQDFATNTPFEVEGLTKTFVTLQNFGIKPTAEVMNALTNQAAKLGGEQETLEGITLALGQAYAKGRLQAEEMNQLTERGVPIYDLLAQATGRNAAQLQEMAEKGELTREVIDRVIVSMGQLANGANAQAMDTVKGRISNLTDAWHQFEDALINGKMEAFFRGMIGSVTDLLNLLKKFISTDVDQQIAHAESRIQQFDSLGSVGRALADYTGYDINVEKNKRDALLRVKAKQDEAAKTLQIARDSAAAIAQTTQWMAEIDAEDAKKRESAAKTRKKAADHALSSVNQQAKAEASRRDEIAKTIEQIQFETSLIGLNDKARQRAVELTQALTKAKGAEAESIKSALQAKWAEIDADARRTAQQEQSLKDAMALKGLQDSAADAQHLVALAKQLKVQGLSNEAIREAIDLEKELAAARKTYMSQEHDLDPKEFEKHITARKAAEAELSKIIDNGSQKSADFMEAAWKRAAENIQDALANMFENLLNGDALGSFEDFFDNIKRSLNKVFAQNFAQGIQNMLQSAFTSGGSGGSSGGIGGLFSGLFGGSSSGGGNWFSSLFGGSSSGGNYFKGNGPLLNYQNPASGGGLGGLFSQFFSSGSGGGFSFSSAGGGGSGWAALGGLAKLIPGAGSYALKGPQRDSSLQSYFGISNTITDMVGNFFPIAKLIAPIKNLMLNLGGKLFPNRRPTLMSYGLGSLVGLLTHTGPLGHLLTTFLMGEKIPQPTEWTKGRYSNGKISIGKSGTEDGGNKQNTIDFTNSFGDMVTSLGHQLNMSFRDFNTTFWHQLDKTGTDQFAGGLSDKGGNFWVRTLSSGGDFKTLANQASLAVIKRNIASQDDLHYRAAIRDSKSLKKLSKAIEEIDGIGLSIGEYGQALQQLKAINGQFDELAISARKYRFAEADIEAARQRAIDSLKNDTITAFRQLAGLGPTLAAQLAGLNDQLLALEANARSLKIAESDLVGLREKAIAVAKEQYLSPLTDATASIADQIASITGVLPTAEDTAPLFELLKASTDPTEQARYIDRIQRALTQRYNGEIAAINKTAGAVSNLKAFVDSLKLSDLSPLDPAARLREAQGQYGQTLLKAQAGDQTALANLAGTAQSYLQEAKSFYASSPAYADIFSNVTDTLGSLGASVGGNIDATDAATTATDALASSLQGLADLIAQLTATAGGNFDNQAGGLGGAASGPAKNFQDLTEDQKRANIDALSDTASKAEQKAVKAANKQLDSQIKAWLFGGDAELAKTKAYQELTASIDDINEQIKATAANDPQRGNLKAQLAGLVAQRKALGKVKFKEAGGWTQGLTIVGENGPELINFARPTQVQSNRQTQSIINNGNDAIVAELRKANEELVALVRLQMEANQQLLERLDRMAAGVGSIERKTRLKASA
ncbi:tape measure protein [Methylomicrobium lacus]|uniref:tape measure protein n=1 Tax=Methylomicrobium lacus TaxID=136992 RepID=UPI00045E9A58|nr:tape measure protein [Methylomicrobium lacus]